MHVHANQEHSEDITRVKATHPALPLLFSGLRQPSGSRRSRIEVLYFSSVSLAKCCTALTCRFVSGSMCSSCAGVAEVHSQRSRGFGLEQVRQGWLSGQARFRFFGIAPVAETAQCPTGTKTQPRPPNSEFHWDRPHPKSQLTEQYWDQH